LANTSNLNKLTAERSQRLQLYVANRSPRAVFVLLDLAGLDEVAEDRLRVEAIVEFFLALLDLSLELLELVELLLNCSVLFLRLLALGLHNSSRATTLRPNRDHVHANAILDCKNG
jgi:hypothetical protein